LRLGMFRTISIQDAEEAWSRSAAGMTWWWKCRWVFNSCYFVTSFF
jgi:hypothetical protein